MILGVRIRNFDVFDDDSCGVLIEDIINSSGDKGAIKLKNLNALIGRNQTGKTSFLMALSFVKRCILTDVAQASKLDGRPGFSNLLINKDEPARFDIFFRVRDSKTNVSKYIQYELSIKASEFGSPVVYAEKILMVGEGNTIVTLLDLTYGNGVICESGELKETCISSEHQTAISVFGHIGTYPDICALYREIYRWFFCSFSTEGISSYYMEGNAPGGHRHLNSTGSNLQNVLEYMEQTDSDNYDRTINKILSKIPAMKHKKKLPPNLDESPDKLFLYLLLLSDTDPHSTIFIETPDKDLYHDMVDVLSDEMRDFTIRNPYSQIIFSTHNPYIVENMSPKEIWVFTRDFGNPDDDSVKIKCAGSDPVVDALFKEGVGMGAIWYGGHLDEPGEGEASTEDE